MSAVDELLARHRAIRAQSEPPGLLHGRPKLRLVLVTCMDTRINPCRIFGLREGDAHVVRNAGGLITDDVLRSLTLSQHALGTSEVVVMQHTDCGLLGLKDAELLGRVTAHAGEEPPFAFGGFHDLEQSVREGVKRVRSAPWLQVRHSVRGFVFDIDSDEVREVEV